jgi:RNA polymerase sigma-70 factor (ECF subfamily)
VESDSEGQLALCQRLHPRLVGSLALYCGRVDVAEELAQEALTRACARWPQVAGMANPDGWVFTVAFNLARSWFRRRSAERRAFSRQAAALSVACDADQADVIAVRTALACLPDRQRCAVVLRHYAGLPIAEVATLMHCAPGTVQALTAQGLRALRTEFTDHLTEGSTDGR